MVNTSWVNKQPFSFRRVCFGIKNLGQPKEVVSVAVRDQGETVMQGIALDEIARIEGVSVGTVKSRLARARDKLRALLPRPVERS